MAEYECVEPDCAEPGRHPWTTRIVTGGSSSRGSKGLASGSTVYSSSSETSYRNDSFHLCDAHYTERLEALAAQRAADRRRNLFVATLLVAVGAGGFAVYSFNTHEAAPTQTMSTTPPATLTGNALASPDAPAVPAAQGAIPADTVPPASVDAQYADGEDATATTPTAAPLTETQAIGRSLATGRATDYGTDANGGTIRVRDEAPEDGRPCRSYMALENTLATSWAIACREQSGRWRPVD